MANPLFDDLVESIKEAGQIRRGEVQASRRFTMNAMDVKKVREGTGLSQSDFADLLHVSVKTLQNWEQGRTRPSGAAQTLLAVAQRHPEVLRELVA